MGVGTKERGRYHFGAYQVDSDSLELHKDGVRIKVREQVFRILVLMLERPGELITREEFRHRLWPDDTYVNFDKSLNTAVNKLRAILGDSAVTPRFIETIPRHGYRFLAEVRKIEEAAEPLEREESGSSTLAATPGLAVNVLEASAGRGIHPLIWATIGFLAAGTLGWFSSRALSPASNIESLRAVPLTSYPGSSRSASFSPDGSQVAFAWTREGVEIRHLCASSRRYRAAEADGFPNKCIRSRLVPGWLFDRVYTGFNRRALQYHVDPPDRRTAAKGG